ncbi:MULTISPECIES: hypothetical protein [unclassified Bradyrhizobium]|uniref:hypothetical protein n=1 Tax=unclassified Bradyrhizobium TaxID=2631580 RepID=UPI001FFB2398|nr:MULTISPECIES: hypothetical protein [unclassified Bradyrhizobium]MCK1279455.1 hypothetical protein [Bradyrhizobium sp. 61]MCK1445856.1 hypothetical protein [Bradyrhizobium sp. 48]MCK1460965.1 hypothetical protein [Bradyrhizobium sp. 2]
MAVLAQVKARPFRSGPRHPELSAPFRVSQIEEICEGAKMKAERLFQIAIFGLFMFSAILASMLILTP